MTKREKAVAVAKDVLKQLKAKTIQAHQGVYVSIALKEPIKVGCDLQTALLKQQFCSVCAMGAAMVSYAKLFDNVPVLENANGLAAIKSYGGDVLGASRDQAEAVLKRILSEKEIALLEGAFEAGGWAADGRPMDNREASADAEGWGAYFYGLSLGGNSSERLKGLMRNIIRNKGYFVVPKKFIAQGKEPAGAWS